MLLLQENNKEAIDSITRFSDLHRYFLEMINKREISLAEELRFIRNYLELEHKRVHLDAPFEYTISPYDENAATINIPPMILHPLVENAVKYCGFNPSQTDHSSIRIDILLDGHLATIGIENSLGVDETRSNIGFRRGVEIVRETIAIYNKMGHNQINFHPYRPPIHFQPGFRCELVVDMQR
jgi:LytS/YehU family sensor histidine kinase